jgi:hypothetical protein
MSSGDSQHSDRERADEETSRARGRSEGTQHPAPPAEGKWRGILGQVRGLLARRRRDARRSS